LTLLIGHQEEHLAYKINKNHSGNHHGPPWRPLDASNLPK